LIRLLKEAINERSTLDRGESCNIEDVLFRVHGRDLATRFRQWRIGGRRFFVGVVLVLIAALLEEGSQYFLSTRNFDLWDAFADVVGVTLAQLFCFLWLGTGNRYRQMRRKLR